MYVPKFYKNIDYYFIVWYIDGINNIDFLYIDECTYLNFFDIRGDMMINEQMTLGEIGELLNLNESYFCRLFKKATGSTFTEYLNFVRICKAEHMIKNGASISESAYGVGFSSLSYFNRVFVRFFGENPSVVAKK